MTNFIMFRGKSKRGAQIQVKLDPYNRVWIYYPKARRRRLYIEEPVDVLAGITKGFTGVKEQLLKDGYRLEA